MDATIDSPSTADDRRGFGRVTASARASVGGAVDAGTALASRALLVGTQAVKPSLSILIFHRVLPTRDDMLPMVPTAQDFERILRWLGAHYRVAPLAEAVTDLRAGKLHSPTACVTFDDGYLDNLEIAEPVAARLGMPITVFCTTAHLDGSMMWNDRVVESVRAWQGDTMALEDLGFGTLGIASHADQRVAIRTLIQALKYRTHSERMAACSELMRRAFDAPGAPPTPRLMMNEAETAELAARGVHIGSHTHSHPILAGLDDAAAREEIVSNRDRLRDITGQPVDTFAYPNGYPGKDYTRATRDLVAELGFTAAVSTSLGITRPDTDPFQLPRFVPWQKTRGKFLAAMMLNSLKRGPDVVV